MSLIIYNYNVFFYKQKQTDFLNRVKTKTTVFTGRYLELTWCHIICTLIVELVEEY